MPSPFITLQHLLPKHALSRLGSRLAASQIPWLSGPLIRWFKKTYEVDLSEAQIQDPEGFASFNDFFTRALQPSARPIDANPLGIACPADGTISQCGKIEAGQLLQAKGITYSLAELAASDDVERYNGGEFATVYLAPSNYHRLHLPLAGTLTRTTAVPGELFSVNTATAQGVRNLFCRNERLVCHFDTAAGEMLVVLVGALIVASIEAVWPEASSPYQNLSSQSFPENAYQFGKGDEIGRFLLGSTVIVCFEAGATQWQDTLQAGQQVQMGEGIGALVGALS
jgi:phosphatidylserine decarboxylase